MARASLRFLAEYQAMMLALFQAAQIEMVVVARGLYESQEVHVERSCSCQIVHKEFGMRGTQYVENRPALIAGNHRCLLFCDYALLLHTGCVPKTRTTSITIITDSVHQSDVLSECKIALGQEDRPRCMISRAACSVIIQRRAYCKTGTLSWRSFETAWLLDIVRLALLSARMKSQPAMSSTPTSETHMMTRATAVLVLLVKFWTNHAR